MANRLFALLVGIDRYANPDQAPPLRGCVADVEASYALLTGRFAVPDDHIRLLTARHDQSEPESQRATRANLIAGWQEHLTQAGPDDIVFFHFSGHGSQARSPFPAAPNGYQATLVPYDSRTPGVFDLSAPELAALIRSVEARGAQVILLIDCCHAASRPRHADPHRCPPVRCCAPDDRMRPAESVLAGADALPASPLRPTPSGWLPLGRHLLLAACRAHEWCYELRLPGSDFMPDDVPWQGAASYGFHQAVAAAGPETTWAQVHDAMLSQVHAVYPHQSPQLEGPGHLTLWHNAPQAVTPPLRVLAVEGNEYVQVNGGAALGLTPGSRLALYAPAADLDGDPLAYGLVEEVQASHAWAKLDRLAELPPTVRARVLALGWDAPPYRVQTADASIQQALVAGERSPFLLPDVDASMPHDDPSSPSCVPDFVVEEEDGLYLLRDATGESLVDVQPPATPEGALQAVAMLEHIAVYRNIQRFTNPLGGALAAQLEVEAVTYTQLGRAGRPLDPAPLRDSGHTAIVEDGQKLLVTVHNRGDAPVYIAVLSLDSDYGITRIFPARTSYHLVPPQGSAVLEPLEPRVTGLGRTQSRETLKVMAARLPTSFDVLQLPKLTQGDVRAGARADEETTLGRLLNGVRRQGAQGLALPNDPHAADWAALHLELTVLGRSASQPLIAGVTQVEAADGWVIEKPAGFEGEWLVSNLDLATRGLEDAAGLRLPPGLDNPDAADCFRPVVGDEATRSPARAPVVVGLAADAEHLAAIDPTHPIQVELPMDDEPGLAGIVPIAYDGQFFYLAGLPAPLNGRNAALPGQRRLACEIHFLPPPVESGDAPVGRDLKRTVRLFFYKLFSRGLPAAAGLRRADVTGHRALYQPASAEEIRRARHIGLLIHGFTGSTQPMVESLWPWVQAVGGYDLCLTFDYDPFGVSLRRNAQQLAAALQGVGIGPDDAVTIDIFADGVGSQLARAVIELLGGDRCIDRLLMAGPPNAGLSLARGRALIPWLCHLLVNLPNSVPPALVAHWLLERLTTASPGLTDLEPGSPFYEELNAPWRVPADVPYYLLIGSGTRAFPQGKELARRLVQGAGIQLDALLREDNDLVVSEESARALDTRWPRLEVAQVDAHHFQYFDAEGARRALARWLGEGERNHSGL